MLVKVVGLIVAGARVVAAARATVAVFVLAVLLVVRTTRSHNESDTAQDSATDRLGQWEVWTN